MSSGYSLGEHFERFIEAQLASGRYSSASEVLQAGLRMLEQRDEGRARSVEEIRRTIEAGRRSERTIPADEVFGRLEAKIREKLPRP